MNISPTPAPAPHSSANTAEKPLSASHSTSGASFVDLLSGARKDPPEEKRDTGPRNKSHDEKQRDAGDAKLQDAEKFLEVQPLQNPTVTVPTAPLADAADPAGSAITDSSSGSLLFTQAGAAVQTRDFQTQGTYGALASDAAKIGSPGGDATQAAALADSLGQQANSVTPRSNASAKSSAGAEATALGDAEKKKNLTLSLNENGAADPNGTPVAKERRDMPELSNEQHLPTPANTATAAFTGDAAVSAKLTAVPEKISAPRRIEAQTFTAASNTATPILATEFRSESAAPVPSHSGPAPSAESQAAIHFVEHAMDLAERVNVKGGNHAEVQMRLLDGKEVTVSLHLANGEWKAVFKTDTDSLRTALEQGWQQSAAQPSSRTVRFSAPAFESSQTQTGSGGNAQQQPDARERNFPRQEQENIFTAQPNLSRPIAAVVTPSHLAAAGKIRLYA